MRTDKPTQTFLSTLLLCAVLSACEGPTLHADAASQITRPIVGGQNATADQRYATVGLRMRSGNASSTCTGTLVAPRVVVTAAHCVEGLNASQIDVIVGRLNINGAIPASALYPVERFAIPARYFENQPPVTDPRGLANNGDIAVVILNDAITSVTPARILPMAGIDTVLTKDTPLVITGYGVTSSNANNSGTLRIAEAPYVRRSATEVLAGSWGTPSTCMGDSGGPAYLMQNGTPWLVGATSRGTFSNVVCGDGAIYSLVSAYEPWIRETAPGLYPADGVCSSCLGDDDCGADAACLVTGGQGVCVDRCDGGGACGTGFGCAGGLCVPESDLRCGGNSVVEVDQCGRVLGVVEACDGRCDNATCVDAAPGDTCENATPLAVASVTLSGSFADYTNQGTQSCGGAGPDRFFAFTLTGPTRLDAIATGVDTVLALRRGCSAATDAVCNDDYWQGSVASRLWVDLPAGEWVLVLDTYAATTGNYELSLSFSSPSP